MLKKLFDPQHDIGQALITVRPALRQAAAFSLVLNLLSLVPSLYLPTVSDLLLIHI